MAFQGSLKELPLPDIIQLVSVSGKTGKFTLTRDGENGYIYLRNGQMVHAYVGELSGEEAIYALAIWNHGDFKFTPGEETDRTTITRSNTNLLMEAARRLDEWRILSRKIPSVDMVPELHVRENRHEQVTLNPQEWLVVTRIDGRRAITDIAASLGASPFDVAKILYGLISSELVLLKKKAEPLSNSFDSELAGVATRIRELAEARLGDNGQKTIEKHYRTALDMIRAGDGDTAIRIMIAEIEKTANLLGGLAVSEQLRADLSTIAPVEH